MEPRQQILAGVFLGLILIAYGIRKRHKSGQITISGKVDYGYVLKLILLALTVAGAIINVILMLLFVVAWGTHVDQPGSPPAPLESFLPVGYPVHMVMGLMVSGALCIFTLAVIGFLDHINSQTSAG